MKRCWRCADDIVDPFRRLDCKFRNSARELQSWAASKVGNIRLQLRRLARELILQLDKAQERKKAAQRVQEVDISEGSSRRGA